jgi:hypothetical protein
VDGTDRATPKEGDGCSRSGAETGWHYVRSLARRDTVRPAGAMAGRRAYVARGSVMGGFSVEIETLASVSSEHGRARQSA